MSYGPALTGANPNQRTWHLTFAKNNVGAASEFSYANYTWDMPDLTTLTESYVQRAIYTVEKISVLNINGVANKDVLVLCDACDTSFNIGRFVSQTPATQQTPMVETKHTNDQAIGHIHGGAGNHLTSDHMMSFVGKWPVRTIAFQVANPFNPSNIHQANGTNGEMILSLKVEVIEPLTNVTNEVVQTADYSGIKRARVAPQPPV